ncbi:MAG: endonuclease/exonuclease/phosphatase family protein [Planctomycetes bacterium]|nr:endonuclease/exonuclease/phosphatase family protein [Planctomycetota bacterium]
MRPSNLLALLALPALPATLAPHLPAWHWSIDLLACFPVQAMAWLGLLAGALAVLRRWRPALLCLFGSLLAAAGVVPGWIHLGGHGTGSDPVVRVLSLNLLRGAEAHAAEALAAVAGSDADVVFCSELTPAWLAALAPLLARYPHHHLAPDPGYFGTGLFVRWPLRRAETIPLGVDWAPALRAIARTPHGDLGILGVHVPRPGIGERCRQRDAALAAIQPAIAALPPRRLLLGDFNATPWNAAFRRLVAEAGLDPGSARAFRPTWPSALPWPLRVPIDHVLLGGALELAAAEVGKPFGSDHLPLSATVRLVRR